MLESGFATIYIYAPHAPHLGAIGPGSTAQPRREDQEVQAQGCEESPHLGGGGQMQYVEVKMDVRVGENDMHTASSTPSPPHIYTLDTYIYT